VTLTGCAEAEAIPVIPEGYSPYWSEELGITFEYPPGVGVVEYPERGGFAVGGPGGAWYIYGTAVTPGNEENVAPDFDYLYGMRPENVLNALQMYTEFGAAESTYQSIPAVEGEAQYALTTDSAAGYQIIGAVGTPVHLILLTGQASEGQEDAMIEVFLNVLATARFTSEPPPGLPIETP